MISSDVMNDLLKNTPFEVMTDSKVLTSRKKVRTPIEALNCLLGGGLPMGIVAHIYGEPKAGKSTFLYQTMGLFQEDYPDGISVIVDMESSADPNRLKSLGVDVSRVVRLPATSIENGFISLMNLIKNAEGIPDLENVPIFVIWDTISKGMATDSTIQSRMAAMERARVIKGYMSELQKMIERHDFFLGLLNQIIYTTDRYGNRKTEAGGGIALKHDNQFSMFFRLKSDEFDDYNMLVGRVSEAIIDKSKICPEVRNIPYYMDVTEGALIKSSESLTRYMYNLGILDPGSKGWYSFQRTLDHEFCDKLSRFVFERLGINGSQKLRWNDFDREISSSDIILSVLKHMYMLLVESKFSLQKEVMKEYHSAVINRIKEIGISDCLFSEDEFNNLLNGGIEEDSVDEQEL